MAQVISFTNTPEYYDHPYYDDKLAILVSQIKIWRCKDTKWFDIPSANDTNKCLCLRECESIEITDNSKDVINKAVIRFPRGTVIAQSSRLADNVKAGNAEDNTEVEGSLGSITNDGEVYLKSAAIYSGGDKEGTSVTPMTLDYDSKGLIEFNRTDEAPALLSPNDLAVGNRIQIRLGYAYSEEEFEEMNSADSHELMPVVFTGFITAISSTTPLEIECTNMAYVLDCYSAPNDTIKNTITVKEFLDAEGKYHVLEGTGIELAESSKGQDISVSGGEITENLTVADVLQAWSDGGVRTLLRLDHQTGEVKLHCGLIYYAGKEGSDLPNKDKKYITFREKDNNSIKILQSDWDVTEDRLKIKESDKKFLAITATGKVLDEGKVKTFKLTIRKNPNTDDNGWLVTEGDELEDTWQTVNSTEYKKRDKPKKNKGGNSSTVVKDRRIKNKVDMKRYTVIPYISLKMNITKAELEEEAKQFWEKCSPNGISGELEIFGDVMVDPTDMIGLIDLRHPEKNGYYFVESVNTKFGLHGYRREIKLPFKIGPLQPKIQTI